MVYYLLVLENVKIAKKFWFVCILKRPNILFALKKLLMQKKILFKNYLLFFKNCTKEKKQIINLRLPV